MRRGIEHLLRSADAPNPERAEALWAEYRAGGAAADGAFATLLAWYGGPLYRRIWGFVRSDDADDLFQDVLARLHRERGRLPTFADALRWLRTVAVTYCIDAHRRATRRAVRERARAVSEGASDSAAERLDLNDALRVGLGKLSAREQQAIALVFFEGLSRQDAAAVAGVNRDTFARALDGALAKLRAGLAAGAAITVAAGTASLEAALTVRPPFVIHLRLTELATAALNKPAPAPPLGGGWLAGKKVLLVSLVVLSASLVTWSFVMPVAPKTRLGVERLEARDNPAGGLLDTTFGTNGLATAADMDRGYVKVAAQSDGKVLVVGTVNRPAGGETAAVTRLKTDGTVDTTFGTNGTAQVPVGKSSRGEAVAIQPDGKILVAGQAYTKLSKFWLTPEDSEYAVARLNSDGTLDKTFGGANTGWWESNPTSGNEQITQLAVTGSGSSLSIYAGGRGTLNGAEAVTVVKLTSAGKADTAYGTNGVAAKNASNTTSSATGFAVTPTGRAVVLAYTSLIGFTSAGMVDSGFGNSGVVTTSRLSYWAIAAQGEKIIAVGDRKPDAAVNILQGVITRYTYAGSVDTTFGTNGEFYGPPVVNTATLTSGNRFSGVVVKDDGTIVAKGYIARKDSNGVLTKGVLLAKLTADGQADGAFGTDGTGLVARYDVSQTVSGYNAGDGGGIALDGDGNILLGVRITGSPKGAVLRFTGG